MLFKQTSKAISAAVVAAVLLAVGSASGSASRDMSPSGTLRLLALSNNEPGVEADIKAFNKEYPGIKIVPQFIEDTATYISVLHTDIQAGSAPDMFFLLPGVSFGIGTWSLGPNGADVLANLANSPWVKDLGAGERLYMTQKDQVVAAPLSLGATGLYINLTVFDHLKLKAPNTIANLLTDCHALRAAGKIPITYVGVTTPTVILGYLVLHDVYEQDPQWTKQRDSGLLTFAGSAVWSRVFTTWQQMVSAGCFSSGAAGTSLGEGQADFATGQAGMSADASSSYPNYLQINPRLRAEFVDFPTDSVKQQAGLVSANTDLAIYKNTKHDALAKMFVNFAMEQKQEASFTKAINSFPYYYGDKGIKVELPPLLKNMHKPIRLSQLSAWPNSNPQTIATNAFVGMLTGQTTSIAAVLQQMDAAW